MTTLLAVSPHLDDAVFSVGGTLAALAREGVRVVVATCFTASVPDPSGFALACQLDKGLDASVDYMALRRAEDVAACAAVGAMAIHLPFAEAPHRGYGSAAALFAERREDDGVEAMLASALATLIGRLAPDRMLGPIGIGDHVDHQVVRSALTGPGRTVEWWEDWPYADRADPPDRSRAVAHRLSVEDTANKIAGCQAYASQLGFQFGGAEPMAERLGRIDAEWLHPDPAPVTRRPDRRCI